LRFLTLHPFSFFVSLFFSLCYFVNGAMAKDLMMFVTGIRLRW
jgi:hypothetical protein